MLNRSTSRQKLLEERRTRLSIETKKLIRSENKPTIGLGLIVRNEEKDLPACLDSFVRSVNVVVLVDTGSTDRTLEIAREKLEASRRYYEIHEYHDANDKNGLLCDFSAARNQYVKHLEKYHIDYIMSCDADDTLVTPDVAGALAADPADIYAIKYRMNDSCWFQSYKIWRKDLNLRYAGRVHECLSVDWTKVVKDTEAVEFLHHWSVNEGQESGTDRNMRILRSEIYPSLRSVFYWANENVDAGNHAEAVKWYLEYIRRANAGEATWPVELAHCYWRAARWCQHLGRTDEAIALSQELLSKDSSWSESWCELAYIARLQGRWADMKKYCIEALKNQYTIRLFSEADKYTITPANMLEVAKLMEQVKP